MIFRQIRRHLSDSSKRASRARIESATIEFLERRRLLNGLSFTAGPSLNLPVAAGAEAAGDFNGDGKPDIATANVNGTISIFLGNGDGSFQPPTTFTDGLANGPTTLTVAEFTNDHHADLIASAKSTTSFPGVVSVLLGNGDGTFDAPSDLSVGAAQVAAVAVADINGDGHPDIVTADGTSGYASILIGNGDGTFKPATTLALPQAPGDIINQNSPGDAEAIVVGDFNGDKNTDIAVTDVIQSPSIGLGISPSINEIEVFLGNGDGTFQPIQRMPMGSNYVMSLAEGDVNNDGRADLIIGTENGHVIQLLANSDGTFVPGANLLSVIGNVNGLALADVTGDAIPDLLLSVASGGRDNLFVLAGNADGSFKLPTLPFSVGNSQVITINGANQFAVADFNNDGLPDVAITSSTGNTLTPLLDTTPGLPSISLNDGTVVANGTPGDDTATISISGGNLLVQIDGIVRQFAASSVNSIDMHLLAGNDSVTIGAGVGPIFVGGMAGNDTIVDNSSSADTLQGGAGADSLTAGGGADLLFGGNGDDTLKSGIGNSTLRGNNGNDSLDGSGGGNDLLCGGPGADTLIGTGVAPDAADTLKGGGGGDNIQIGQNDTVIGAASNDTLSAVHT